MKESKTDYENRTLRMLNEKILTDRIAQHFRQQDYEVYLEVPSMGQSVDLIAVKDDCLVAVEAKIHDWSRAITQCRAHELVADLIYVGVATSSVSERFCREAQSKGYGIIHFEQSTQSIVETLAPIRREGLWSGQRRVVEKSLRRIRDAED